MAPLSSSRSNGNSGAKSGGQQFAAAPEARSKSHLVDDQQKQSQVHALPSRDQRTLYPGSQLPNLPKSWMQSASSPSSS